MVSTVAAAYIDKAYGKDVKGGLPGGRLYVRAAKKKIGGDVEEVAQLCQLFVAAFEDAFFVALIDGLRDAEIRGDLRLRHSVGDATFLHSASYQHFKRHLDKIIRIVYDEDAHIYSYCI